MATNWAKELEALGITLGRVERDPAKRAKSLAGESVKLPATAQAWLNARTTDDTLIDPAIAGNAKMRALFELTQAEASLGNMANRLYNGGITHVISVDETEFILGRPDSTKFDEGGIYLQKEKLSTTELASLSQDVIVHEAGHAVSYLLAEPVQDAIDRHLPEAISAFKKDIKALPPETWQALKSHSNPMVQTWASTQGKLHQDLVNRPSGTLHYLEIVMNPDDYKLGNYMVDPFSSTLTAIGAINSDPELAKHFPQLTGVRDKHQAIFSTIQTEGFALKMIGEIAHHPKLMEAMKKDIEHIKRNGYAASNDGYLRGHPAGDFNAHHYLTRALGGEHDTEPQMATEAFAELFADVVTGTQNPRLSVYMPNMTKEVSALVHTLKDTSLGVAKDRKAAVTVDQGGAEQPLTCGFAFSKLDDAIKDTMKTARATGVAYDRDAALTSGLKKIREETGQSEGMSDADMLEKIKADGCSLPMMLKNAKVKDDAQPAKDGQGR
ncbi:MAG: hypothetical protein MRY32_01255 [Rickettsiales bacterium]|nr:hypothetical protein [Rickettsiales bacterium]